MRVAEVMTTEVLTVTQETTLKEVATLLAARGISGAPVIDEAGRIVGVVSEADILAKERRPQQQSRLGRILGYAAPVSPKAQARTAGEAMTAPPIVITADRRVDTAASLMLDRQVNRLPVVDRAGVLVGIVTRADLVRAFVHTDEQIERDIREEVLLQELWLDPNEFEITVSGGEVTLSGPVISDSEHYLLARRIGLVPGVVSVDVHEAAHH